MLIGELSSRSGLSRDTIRFYEKHRLITVGRKERRHNNYKEYSEEILQRLVSIKAIKGLGFTLNEVSEVLNMMDVNEATCNTMYDKIEDKVKRVDQKINELGNVRALLVNGMEKCSSSCNPSTLEENCPMLVSIV